jgi:hypothetical protein
MIPPASPNTASFRDPDGYVFQEDGCWYRAITPRGLPVLEHLEHSGLYAELTRAGLLASHETTPHTTIENATRVLLPEQVPFVSYASEWGFAQLKDAARLTLDVHERALNRGAWMVDAATSNVQFLRGAPKLIDTLSVKPLQPGIPWTAYRQFCEQFLAPLSLAATHGSGALAFLRAFPEGMPLPLVSRLLPWRTWLKPGLLTHLHAHALAIRAATSGAKRSKPAHRPVSLNALKGLARSLAGCIEGLRAARPRAAWLGYYEQDMLVDGYLQQKERIVGGWIESRKPKSVWDAGANTGQFSRLAATNGASVIALEAEPACVDRIYVECCRKARLDVLPLVMDLAQPTPAGGWALRERRSLTDRGRPDLILALAVVHHLALGRNLPLPMIADFLASLAPHLIIEFVPKTDPNAQRLLAFREDIFPAYTQEGFEAAFGGHYTIEARQPLERTERWLYLLHRRPA